MRKYNRQQVEAMLAGVNTLIDDMRAIHDAHKNKLQELEQTKKNFAPVYFESLNRDAKTDAFRALTFLSAQLKENAGALLAERHSYSRESYLLDAGFNNPKKNWVDAEKGATVEALNTVATAIQQLTLSTRLHRLNDEMLVHYARHAHDANDSGLAGLVLEEAKIRASERSNSLVLMQVREHVDKIENEEAEFMENAFASIDAAVEEVAAIGRLIQDAKDQIAYAALRSKEITQARQEREAAEEAERLAKAEEVKKEREKEEKAHVEKILDRPVSLPPNA